MSAPPGDVHIELDVSGAGPGDGIHRPIPVKHHGIAAADHRIIQIRRPYQSDFLPPGKHYLHRTPRPPVLRRAFQSLQNRRHPRLAIAP